MHGHARRADLAVLLPHTKTQALIHSAQRPRPSCREEDAGMDVLEEGSRTS